MEVYKSLGSKLPVKVESLKTQPCEPAHRPVREMEKTLMTELKAEIKGSRQEIKRVLKRTHHRGRGGGGLYPGRGERGSKSDAFFGLQVDGPITRGGGGGALISSSSRYY